MPNDFVKLKQRFGAALLGSAGFRCDRARALPEGAHGPAAPDRWHWRPRRPGERERDERRPAQNKARPAQNKARPAQDKRPPRSKPHDERPKEQRNEKPRGRPDDRRGGKPRHEPRPAPKIDTGPARAGGAFDKLADLLKG